MNKAISSNASLQSDEFDMMKPFVLNIFIRPFQGFNQTSKADMLSYVFTVSLAPVQNLCELPRAKNTVTVWSLRGEQCLITHPSKPHRRIMSPVKGKSLKKCFNQSKNALNLRNNV